MGRDGHCDVGGMVPFGPLVVRQQKFLGGRNNVISQMQGFGIFLKPHIFFGLRLAAFHGSAILRLSSVYHISSSIIVSVGYRHPHPPPQPSAHHCCYIQRFLYPCEQVAGSIHRTQCPSFVRPVVDWTHERRTSSLLTMRTLWYVLYSKVSLVGQ